MNARQDPDAFEVTNNTGNTVGPSVSPARKQKTARAPFPSYDPKEQYFFEEIFDDLFKQSRLERSFLPKFTEFATLLDGARGRSLSVPKNCKGAHYDSVDALCDSVRLCKTIKQNRRTVDITTMDDAVLRVGKNEITFVNEANTGKEFDQKAAHAMVMLAISDPHMMPPNAIRIDNASDDEKHLIENAVADVSQKYGITLKIHNPLNAPEAAPAEPEQAQTSQAQPAQAKPTEQTNPAEAVPAVAQEQGKVGETSEPVMPKAATLPDIIPPSNGMSAEEMLARLKQEREILGSRISEGETTQESLAQKLEELEAETNPQAQLLIKIAENLRQVRPDFLFDPQMIAGRREDGISIYKISIDGHDIFYAKDKGWEPFLTRVTHGNTVLYDLETHRIYEDKPATKFPSVQGNLIQEWKKPVALDSSLDEGVLATLSRGKKPLAGKAKGDFCKSNKESSGFPSLSQKVQSVWNPDKQDYITAQIRFDI